MTEEPKWQNLMVDSQILSSFMSCPRKMNYQFLQHLVPIQGPSQSILKGSLIHHGLQSYYSSYSNGDQYRDRVKAGLSIMREKAPELGLDAENTLLVYRTFEEYCEYKQSEILQILGIEKVFKQVIYEEFPLRVIVTGRMDLVIQDDYLRKGSPQIIPVDFKSESEKWFHSVLRNQYMIYSIVCNSPVMYIQRVGFQKTKKAEEKFERVILDMVPSVLQEFQFSTVPHYAKQLLIAMEDNYFPPNHTACTSGHFACQFSDKYYGGICSVAPNMRSAKLERYFESREWNPSDEI